MRRLAAYVTTTLLTAGCASPQVTQSYAPAAAPIRAMRDAGTSLRISVFTSVNDTETCFGFEFPGSLAPGLTSAISSAADLNSSIAESANVKSVAQISLEISLFKMQCSAAPSGVTVKGVLTTQSGKTRHVSITRTTEFSLNAQTSVPRMVAALRNVIDQIQLEAVALSRE